MAVKFDISITMRDYLDRNDWHYEYHDDHDYIDCYIDLKKKKFKKLHLFIRFNQFGFINYAVLGMNADEESRNEVNKYLAMANYGLRNGNFEIDMTDGEVRYKVYTNCDGMSILPDEVMEDCMLVPVRMFDKYGDGLLAVMMGFSDAETEIKKAESEG